MLLTTEQFRAIFPGNHAPDAWTAAINAICPRYGIDSPTRLAAFLAQAGHESMGFTRLVENLNYSAQGLANTWPNRYAENPAAREKTPNKLALRLQRNPEAIANNCYANRMGNGPEASGDGWLFKGYGPFQLTGRGPRTDFARAIGKPLNESEAYLLTPEGGIESACWFWTTRNLTPLADAGKIDEISRKINGGTLGLLDRRARFEQAQSILA